MLITKKEISWIIQCLAEIEELDMYADDSLDHYGLNGETMAIEDHKELIKKLASDG